MVKSKLLIKEFSFTYIKYEETLVFIYSKEYKGKEDKMKKFL